MLINSFTSLYPLGFPSTISRCFESRASSRISRVSLSSLLKTVAFHPEQQTKRTNTTWFARIEPTGGQATDVGELMDAMGTSGVDIAVRSSPSRTLVVCIIFSPARAHQRRKMPMQRVGGGRGFAIGARTQRSPGDTRPSSRS
jgi:hypothetical protein